MKSEREKKAEEVIKNAEEAFAKAVSEKIAKEINEWMKSASL